MLTTNGILNAILMASCALLFPQTPRTIILLVLFVNGLSRSMQFTSVGTLAFADIAKPDMSSATSFFSMITQMSMGMGVAVGRHRCCASLDCWTAIQRDGPTTKEFHIAFLLVALLSARGDARLFHSRSGRGRDGQRASRESSSGEKFRRDVNQNPHPCKTCKGAAPNSKTSAVAAAAGKFADDGAYEAFGVAEEHQGFVEVVERVIDSGEARGHAALDDHYRVRLVHVENRHAEDGA